MVGIARAHAIHPSIGTVPTGMYIQVS